MSPRKLQNEIKQDFRADNSVWSNYKNSIASEFAQINYQDLSDHLLREFNRKIVNLGLSRNFMFAPFDAGFRFTGSCIPTLDFNFAEDKTIVPRIGPTPTFTRASTATFIGSNGLIQSAAINTPRFDHDPVTLACKGLLIEESRTNLTTQSSNASVWTSANGTVTNNGSTTAPDGSSNGFLGGIGTASLITLPTSSVTGLHTASVFLKRNNTDWVRVQVAQGSFAHAVNFWVNLATGAAGALSVAAGTPTSLSAQVTPFGDSWYRISITASYPATSYLTLTIISATADNNTTRVSGSIYEIWGAQLEAGSFPTSYIPTTTTAAPRSADVCSITDADFTSFYNPSEGTVSLQATSLMATATAGNRTFLSFTDGGYTNQQGIYKTVNSSNLNTPIGSGVGTAVGTITQGVAFKVAVAFQPSNSAASFNGGAAATVSSAAVVGINKLELRDPTGAPSGHPSCHIAQIQYFRKRLPNTELQSLTTL